MIMVLNRHRFRIYLKMSCCSVKTIFSDIKIVSAQLGKSG